MGIAAVAMAVSMFAADVSAKARLEGSLADYDGDKFSVLKLNKQDAPAHNQILNFSTSGDNYGASFKFYNKLNEKDAVADAKYQIWFKPVSLLKITLGQWEVNLNQEQIGWYRANQGKLDPDYGYLISLGEGAWGVDVGFVADNAFWYDGEYFQDFIVKGQYSADFGTINAAAKFTENFSLMNIAAGYKNTFGSVTAFLNVGASFKDPAGDDGFAYTQLKLEPYAGGSAAGFGWKVYLPVTLVKDADAAIGMNAKVDYNLSNGMNANCEFEIGNFTADPFAMTIKPGLTGKVGAMAFEAYAEMKIAGDNFTVGFPVNFTVDF